MVLHFSRLFSLVQQNYENLIFPLTRLLLPSSLPPPKIKAYLAQKAQSEAAYLALQEYNQAW